MGAPDLSILIPARNEMFLARTIEDILEHAEGNTEIIAVLDGQWAEPPIPDHDRVHLIYNHISIGQRAATNQAARMSRAKFIMKCDAHVAFDQGFDVKMMEACEYDWTMVPTMHNLHAFDWVCRECGTRQYQGPRPEQCANCRGANIEMDVVWEVRRRNINYMWFDPDLAFSYFDNNYLAAYGSRQDPTLKPYYDHKYREWAQGEITDQMVAVGACWMMHRERFWELGGCDERHGSWGQMGVEIACKSWLSGGRQVVNKRTWFAHLFRTQKDFSFPYPNPGVQHAKEYSRDLWLNDKWEGAIYPLEWMIARFSPLPGWDQEEVADVGQPEPVETEPEASTPTPEPQVVVVPSRKKGVVYYTDNRLDGRIMQACQNQLIRCKDQYDLWIVAVGLQPLAFGDQRIHVDAERGYLTMFQQILAGILACDADYLYFCEHDVLYHPSHFAFEPEHQDVYYYNENVWKVSAEDGRALFYYCRQTSGLCADRDLLLQHYHRRVSIVEEIGFTRRMGFEPGTHNRKERVDDYKSEAWFSEFPNIDIRHRHNLTPSRWRQDQFRNKRYCQGWTEADEVPGWGTTRHDFEGLLRSKGI